MTKDLFLHNRFCNLALPTSGGASEQHEIITEAKKITEETKDQEDYYKKEAKKLSQFFEKEFNVSEEEEEETPIIKLLTPGEIQMYQNVVEDLVQNVLHTNFTKEGIQKVALTIRNL